MVSSPLNVNVYVAPMRPFVGPAPQGPGDDAIWSPMSSTLISGEHDAILVDTLITDDQVDDLANWVSGFGKQVIGIYVTHDIPTIGLASLACSSTSRGHAHTQQPRSSTVLDSRSRHPLSRHIGRRASPASYR